ncbi:S8 family serine peptidase [Massilia violaceinigra]|uniref:S8 family serine peptidase n=1 Tax=Massilia violaceinigra TaxID=2045208 RepID=A0ABY4A2Z1_9BURK|nr:S8 family serine peptidase [Massilia violaceinigra]UOD29133.1 S8 family serine peptidase [Massilia violaceinigra]
MSNSIEAAPARRRTVLANLIAHLAPGAARAAAFERFSLALERHLLPNADLASSSDGTGVQRRIVVLDMDQDELAAKLRLLPDDVIAEPEMLRSPALAYPAPLQPTRRADASAPGSGAQLELRLVNRWGAGVGGATVMVAFHRIDAPATSVTTGAVSDGAGQVSLAYDALAWAPAFVAVEPAGGYWTLAASQPCSGHTLLLRELDDGAALHWWHLVCGLGGAAMRAGGGVRIGVVDTGIGPHPALAHAHGLGAIADGVFCAGAQAARDCQTHGTHVSGIIGARAMDGADGAATPLGLAPEAQLMMLRIFGQHGGGSQADVSAALDLLAGAHRADIINLSLVGDPSRLEHDAISAAYGHGCVCVCAAGNQNGAAVGAPASYPESIAVSALGLLNTAPPGSMGAFNMPQAPQCFTQGGLFLASFSNVGPQLFCSAPGNGIVSTIPVRGADPEPYADMCGTSMAAPMVSAILACLLAEDDAYLAMPRDQARAIAAKAILARFCHPLGLGYALEGRGVARVAAALRR